MNHRPLITPKKPEFALTRPKELLLLADPNPIANEMDQPIDETVLSPAASTSRLPVPDVALPTTTLTLPNVSGVLDPVRTAIVPLLPFKEVPVLNIRPPLTPEVP